MTKFQPKDILAFTVLIGIGVLKFYGFDGKFDKINAYHKSKGFPISSLGFYVGYHWLIEPDGTIKKARKEDEVGAHDQGENLDSIGICLAGNFNLNMPPEPQAASAAKLLGEIRDRLNIPITKIEPHRQDDQTDCPGKLLGDNWIILNYLDRHPSAV